ncbi:M48 metallopeptidase family protein [Mesotoga prima]|uniref:M48 metallopeptidase family protein n=1 Tax=Mesotoga prima TaxID=1184387 RepID=UPI002C0D0971|nr:M48 family metallopeptidase [Mesotoga prima]HQC14572.1 M48 family metallopeptidase [Mesotoga prima]
MAYLIKVRKMKTLWGSCNRRRVIITLNYILYKAKQPCKEYVMLHELAHFIYAGHIREFYAFLSAHMPGCKERKKILDYEVDLGV